MLFTAACSDVEDTEPDYLERATAALADANATVAYIELKNALRTDPQSAEARWLLGKLYVDVGSADEALKELSLAQNLGWPANDVRPATARALAALRRYDDILALDTEQLDRVSAAEVLAGQSMAALAKGDLEQANVLAQQAQQANPDGTAGAIADAAITSRTGDQAGAMTILQELVERHPDHARGWYLLALNQLSMGRRGAALTSLGRAVDLRPQWVEPRTTRALTYLQLKQADKARQETDALIEIAPENPNVNYLLGLQLLEEKSYSEVIVAMGKAQGLAGRYPLIDYAMGTSLFILGDINEAQVHAEAYFARLPNNVEGRRLFAAVNILNDNYAEAEQLLSPVLDQNPSDKESLALMALALAHSGEIAKSFGFYSWMENLGSDQPLEKGTPGSDIVAAMVTAHTKSETPVSHPEERLIQIINLLGAEDYPAAIAIAKEMQWDNTSNLSGHHILARVYLSAGQPKEAVATLNLALKRDKHDPTANIMMGDLQRLKGDNDAARTYYSNSLEEHPQHMQTLLRLASLEKSANFEAAVLTHLDQAVAAHPNATMPRLQLAHYYLRRGRPSQVAVVFKPLSDLQRQTPQIYSTAILTKLALGNPAFDRETVNKLLEAQPGSDPFFYLLVNAAGRIDRLQELKSPLAQIMRNNPRHMGPLIAAALIAQAEGNTEQLLAYNKALQKLHPNPNNILVLRMAAIAAAAQGDLQEAIAISQRVFDKAPQSPLLLELSSYQLEANEVDAAIASLSEWLQQHPDDLAVRLRLAQAEDVRGDSAAARGHYETILVAKPDEPVALNNLAWLLREDDPVRALEYINQAHKQAPEHAGILDTLAVIQHFNGQGKTALANVEKSLKKDPQNLSTQFHRAMILNGLGRKKQAIEALDGLVSTTPESFPEHAEAKQLLDSLSG